MEIFHGIIYKITNNVNGKIYIGQTINKLEYRWIQHCSGYNKYTLISKSIQKYGKASFKIEEIDGANNVSELNYREQLHIHLFKSLIPNGYNIRGGGGSRGSMGEAEKLLLSLKAKQRHISVGHPNNKAIIDIDNKNTWINAKTCSIDLGISHAALKSWLIGTTFNPTNLRYLGEEFKSKPRPSRRGARLSKKVINIESGEIWNSGKEAFDLNKSTLGKLSYSTFRGKLNGQRSNNTNYKYLVDHNKEEK